MKGELGIWFLNPLFATINELYGSAKTCKGSSSISLFFIIGTIFPILVSTRPTKLLKGYSLGK